MRVCNCSKAIVACFVVILVLFFVFFLNEKKLLEGTASGKTTLAKEICSQLDRRSCLLLCLDSFYRPLTEDEKKDLESDVGFNFDVPSAFDFPLLLGKRN